MDKPFHRLGISDLKNKLKTAETSEEKDKIMNKIKLIQERNKKKKDTKSTNDPRRLEMVEKYINDDDSSHDNETVSFKKSKRLLREYVSSKSILERADRADACDDIPTLDINSIPRINVVDAQQVHVPEPKKSLFSMLELEGYDILTITLQLCPK